MDAVEQAPEILRVQQWRFECAYEKLGVPKLEAKLFATSDADLGRLRDLIETDGCDPRLATLILI